MLSGSRAQPSAPSRERLAEIMSSAHSVDGRSEAATSMMSLSPEWFSLGQVIRLLLLSPLAGHEQLLGPLSSCLSIALRSLQIRHS